MEKKSHKPQQAVCSRWGKSFDFNFRFRNLEIFNLAFMTSGQLKDRTKEFALRVVKLVSALPRDVTGREIGKQILRSGTSVASNYRAACRAKSAADFIYKIKVAEEESDETQFWLEMIMEAGLLSKLKVESLYKESAELTAILTASGKTSRINNRFKEPGKLKISKFKN
jgi:four helix bundle protein